MKRLISKSFLTAIVALAITAVAATGASAATTVDVNAFDQLEVQATAAVNNTINVYPGGGMANYYEVTDSADTVTPGSGCVANSANSVTCGPVLDTVTVWAEDGDDYVSAYFITNQFVAYGSEGDDTLVGAGAASNFLYGENGDDTVTGGTGYDALLGGPGTDTLNGQGGDDYLWGQADNDTLNGGSGVDVLEGGTGGDELNGGTGADTLTGEDGNDTLNGGDDDDTLRGGLGADTFNGDAGVDLATYSEKTAALNISIDAVASDGESGEGDFVSSSIENITGGSYNDYIYASVIGTATNVFDGGSGNDRLFGYGGSDTLTGGPGSDILTGGDGNDTLNNKDGATDSSICGNGTDTANLDLLPKDGIVSGCETINRS